MSQNSLPHNFEKLNKTDPDQPKNTEKCSLSLSLSLSCKFDKLIKPEILAPGFGSRSFSKFNHFLLGPRWTLPYKLVQILYVNSLMRYSVHRQADRQTDTRQWPHHQQSDGCYYLSVVAPSGERLRGMVCLQCKNCVIHTWALQRWASHDGALYKSMHL